MDNAEPQTPQEWLDVVAARLRADDLDGYVRCVLQAAMLTGQRRGHLGTPPNGSAQILETFIIDEWPVFQASFPATELRRYRGALRTIPSILADVWQQRATRTADADHVAVLEERGRATWFEPEPGRVLCDLSWFSRLTVAVELAPENVTDSNKWSNAPDEVIQWLLLRSSDHGLDDAQRQYWHARKAREIKLREPELSNRDSPQHSLDTTPANALRTTAHDELAYQLINLRLLCQLYSQGMHTLYKCATVILRTLLLGSAGHKPLALEIPDVTLPALFVRNLKTDGVLLTNPSRMTIWPNLLAAAGVGMKNINVEGGAVGRLYVGSPFGEAPLPLSIWLEQPFLEPDQTLGGFIRYVVHKDGGAHLELGHTQVLKMQACASIHWPLTIRIGEVVAEELWRQFTKANPDYQLRFP